MAVLGLHCCARFSPVATSMGAPLWLRHVGCSLRWLLLLGSTGSRAHAPRLLQHTGSRAQAQRLWCRAQVLQGMWEIPRSGIKATSLHWQTDLYHRATREAQKRPPSSGLSSLEMLALRPGHHAKRKPTLVYVKSPHEEAHVAGTQAPS